MSKKWSIVYVADLDLLISIHADEQLIHEIRKAHCWRDLAFLTNLERYHLCILGHCCSQDLGVHGPSVHRVVRRLALFQQSRLLFFFNLHRVLRKTCVLCVLSSRCKELVLATVRALFDLIEPETRQVRERSCWVTWQLVCVNGLINRQCAFERQQWLNYSVHCKLGSFCEMTMPKPQTSLSQMGVRVPLGVL